MKLRHRICECPSGRILLAVLAILFILCVRPANAASEPGTVTIVLDVEPESVDPGNASQAATGRVVLQNIGETLTEFNPAESSITPRLATSWKQIDARTWHFFLRKGVKFHDGQDFNAEAAVFNIKRLYDKRIESRVRNNFFSGFKMEGKALDSHTVEIRTDKSEPLLLTLLGLVPICSPSTPVDKWTRSPIGTGPYKFAKWDAGTQIILERFDGYWGRQPQVRKAIYVWRSESSVRAAMVDLGEVDIAISISAKDAMRPDLDYSYFNSETTYLHIFRREPPLNDRRVRMALNYAVDRNAMRGSILSKDVIPAAQMAGPNVFGFNPDLKIWPYDPQKAKQLLDEARKDGVPVDKEILLVGRQGLYPEIAEVMEAVATMYTSVGLNVKRKVIEAGLYRLHQYKPFPKDSGPYLFTGQHNNMTDMVFSLRRYLCDSPFNEICDKKLDDLVEKAAAATGTERRDLCQAVSKITQEEIIPEVILFHMVGYTRVGKRINYKPTIATNGEFQIAQITFK